MKYYGKITDEHDLITVQKGQSIAQEEITKALDPTSGSSVDIRAALTGAVESGNTKFPTGHAVYTAIAGMERLKFQVVDALPTDPDPNTIYLLRDAKTVAVADIYYEWNNNLHYFDTTSLLYVKLPESQFVSGNMYYILYQDSFTEYMYIDGQWEIIGSSNMDLSGFATKNWTNTRLDNYATTGSLSTVATTGEFENLKHIPTTIGGYGITDAKIVDGTITLGTQTITPTTGNLVNGVITINGTSITPDTSVAYNSTDKKFTKTAGGASQDIITIENLKQELQLNNVENTKLSTWTGSDKINTIGAITSGSIGLDNITSATNLQAIEAVEGKGFLKKTNDGWTTADVDLSSTQTKITSIGILKGAGEGTINAATAGTDYLAPVTAVDVQTGDYVVQVTQSTLGQIAVTKGSLPTSLPASDTSSTYESTGTVPLNGIAVNSALTAAIAPLATIASPEFTGTPKAPTAEYTTNDTQIATTAFVKTAIDNVLETSKALTYEGVVPSEAWTAGLTDHTKGDVYIVETAGTYVGVACLIGDMIICKTTAQEASNDHWNVVHTSISDATETEKGIMKLYTTTGTNTDGTITQSAITTAINGRLSSAFEAGTTAPTNTGIFWVDTTTSGQYQLKAYIGGSWVAISSYWS